jgi:hypothetical protein
MLAFYNVNDNKKVNRIVLQTMRCILCHNNPILNLNPKTQVGKDYSYITQLMVWLHWGNILPCSSIKWCGFLNS